MEIPETKLNGCGEFTMSGIKGVKARVGHRCQARKGVAIMPSERMWGIVWWWRAGSSMIVCVHLKCESKT